MIKELEIGQQVFFVREKPPRRYNYKDPERGEIIKLGKTIIHVKLESTGVTHRFRIEGLEDASYTYHKLFLTKDGLERELMMERLAG